MLTEQSNLNTRNIDRLSTLDALRIMNEEDQQVGQVVERALPDIARAVDAIVGRMEAGGRLIYAGAGTSGRLGVLDAVECIPTFNVPPGMVVGLMAGGDKALTHSIEDAEDDGDAAIRDLRAIGLRQEDAVVGIAASGRTPYVLAGIGLARDIGALRVGVSCNVPAPLLDLAEIGIGLPVGPEVIAGSTRLKAGTAQKLALNMLSTMTMVRLGKVYGNLMVDVQVTNHKLARRAQGLVSQLTGLTDEQAAALLIAANNRVKTAVVMHRRGVSAEEARALLDSAKGRLRDVIGDVQ